MLNVGFSHRFYLYRHAADMRKSFDGLCGLVTSEMDRDPQSGDVYIFLNRRQDRIKLLVWDRSGYWLYYKRLEAGRFQRPLRLSEDGSVSLCYDELLLILEGIDLSFVKRRKRYSQRKKAV